MVLLALLVAECCDVLRDAGEDVSWMVVMIAVEASSEVISWTDTLKVD